MTTLVLLPGMDGTGSLFDPLVDALAGKLQVEVVRYPSEAPAGYPELERVAEACMPAEGPLILLGESFSGPIAISLAAKHAGRVIGLILCCTFVRCPFPALSRLTGLAALVPVKWVPTRLAATMLLGRFETPKLRAALGEALAAVSANALRSRLKGVLSVDATSALSRISAPILYLRASDDRVVPTSAGDASRRSPRNVRDRCKPAPDSLCFCSPFSKEPNSGELKVFGNSVSAWQDLTLLNYSISVEGFSDEMGIARSPIDARGRRLRSTCGNP